jgi:DNA mismatch endonuclease (patch repair protein)
LRYRRRSNLVGKPDLVFATPKLVVFVDGDFWHGRGLDDRIARGDFKRNADYWVPKLRRNIQRDAEVTKTLQEQEWRVIRVWESDIQRDLEGVAEMIATEVRSRRPDRQ